MLERNWEILRQLDKDIGADIRSRYGKLGSRAVPQLRAESVDAIFHSGYGKGIDPVEIRPCIIVASGAAVANTGVVFAGFRSGYWRRIARAWVND